MLGGVQQDEMGCGKCGLECQEMNLAVTDRKWEYPSEGSEEGGGEGWFGRESTNLGAPPASFTRQSRELLTAGASPSRTYKASAQTLLKVARWTKHFDLSASGKFLLRYTSVMAVDSISVINGVKKIRIMTRSTLACCYYLV